MVDGVSNEMHEGLGKRVKDALVEIGVLPGDFQRDILAALLGDIAKKARETAEELLDGHHSNLEHALVKLIKNARLKSNGIGEFCAHRITSMPLVEFGERAIEHGLPDDQFADEIHDRIDAGGIHSKGALGYGVGGRAGIGGRRWSAVLAVFGSPVNGLGGLRLQQITEQLVLGSFRGGGTLQTHSGNDRRDVAALRDSRLGLRAGQGGFHNLDGGGANIVLWAESDDGAATVKNVANELEGRGAHQAVWINAQGDVVNGLAAVHGFGNHKLFVFRPSELGGQWRGRRHRLQWSCGLLQ